MSIRKKVADTFRPDSGALAFFTSIAVWGVGTGCFAAVLNNYLAEIYQLDQLQRGWIEFYREMPGLLLVALLAIVHKVSDWRILRIGAIVSMVAVAALALPVNTVMLTLLIMLWSAGEHIIMPIRSAIAMDLAKPGKSGVSLGFVASMMNGGGIMGSLLVACIFWIGVVVFHCESHDNLYRCVWVLITFLMFLSIVSTFSKHAPIDEPSRRPRFYMHRKYSKFYILELFYGARKQIFLTFGPYVLIVIYHLSTVEIAVMMGISCVLNMFGGPVIGRLTDRFGYRAIMIFDTVILSVVCLVYGYADKVFPMNVAVWVVCVNYLLDILISTASMATNLYAKEISRDKNELTATLTTGISVNHLIAVLSAPLGGWVWKEYGVGTLFAFAAVMAVANSVFAWTLPKPKRVFGEESAAELEMNAEPRD